MITAAQALELNETAMRLAAAREAIDSLALLKPESEEIIFHLLSDRFEGHHPREICTSYRKDGEQLSKQELRAIGLRSNAFMSRRAYGDLSIKGQATPLASHETVLLRAVFTMLRYRTITRARETIAEFGDQYKYDMITGTCPTCVALDGTITSGDDASIFAPAGCVCDTANYGFRLHVDFLADW